MSTTHSLQGNSGHNSQQQLGNACRALFDRWQAVDSNDLDFKFHGQDEDQYFSISRPLLLNKAQHLAHGCSETETYGDLSSTEEDEAAIHHSRQLHKNPTVEYHIIHSPSYRVPVLYFFLSHLPTTDFKGIDAVYEYLVPQHRLGEMKDVGVLGALGMANHPVTDLPCFWVHPCNTAEAMSEILSSVKHAVTPEKYLMIWLGLVGSAVGLTLPKEVAISSAE